MSPAATRSIEAVTIGTSAGGIEALGVLLPALQSTCPAAIFVVIHLPRDRPSLLRNLFVPKCALPVTEAEDKLPVEGGRIYFAPPDYHLLIEPGIDGEPTRCALSVDDPVRYSRPSIDVLFESAAEHYADRLMGVILTGANDDGARGLEAVARAGGITVVQDPATAMVDALPAAAVRTGFAQHVLPLPEICSLMTGYLGGAR